MGFCFFSTKNLIKSVCVVHASERCLKLRAIKSNPTNNAYDFEPRSSHEKDSHKKNGVFFKK